VRWLAPPSSARRTTLARFALDRAIKVCGVGPGPRKLDLAWLTELFKRLADGANDDDARRVQWIVGLLLLRRRILEQLSRGERGGAEVLRLRLRLKREEREYEIVDPRLDAAAMVAIEQDLTKMFDLR
jgi:hypothetical protein